MKGLKVIELQSISLKEKVMAFLVTNFDPIPFLSVGVVISKQNIHFIHFFGFDCGSTHKQELICTFYIKSLP